MINPMYWSTDDKATATHLFFSKETQMALNTNTSTNAATTSDNKKQPESGISRLLKMATGNLGDRLANAGLQASTWAPDRDGETAVFVGFRSATRLGKLLDPGAESPFQITGHGQFNSIVGFQLYLIDSNRIRAERWRSMKGGNGAHEARTEIGEDAQRVEGLYQLLAEATLAKVLSNSQLVEQLVENKLPLKVQYVDRQGIVQTPRDAGWQQQALDEVVAFLKWLDAHPTATEEEVAAKMPTFEGLAPRAARPANPEHGFVDPATMPDPAWVSRKDHSRRERGSRSSRRYDARYGDES